MTHFEQLPQRVLRLGQLAQLLDVSRQCGPFIGSVIGKRVRIFLHF
jgi:hypothetical protein